MFRLIYFFVLLYLLYLLFKWFFKQGKKYQKMEGQDGIIDEMVQDPVCKTYIPRKEAFKRSYGGKEILFCSRECADKFKFGKK